MDQSSTWEEFVIDQDKFPFIKKYIPKIKVFKGPLVLLKKIEIFLEKLETIPDTDKDVLFGKFYDLDTKIDHPLLMLILQVWKKRGLPQKAIEQYNDSIRRIMGQ